MIENVKVSSEQIFLTVACVGSRAVDSESISYILYFVSLRENNFKFLSAYIQTQFDNRLK